MEQCKYCGTVIREGYEFECLTCGFGPMCDACYYDHVVNDRHEMPNPPEDEEEEEEEKK